MKRLSLTLTPQFENDLKRFMKDRGIKNKSEALRIAVREVCPKTDFRALIGIATKGPMNPNPRFKTEDDLWKEDGD